MMMWGTVVVLLCAYNVFGLGMMDLLRAARQLEAQDLRRTITSPANAIVEFIQSELDSDENGEVSIAEVETYIKDRWIYPENSAPFTPGYHQTEAKEYMLTLASLIDANGDGNITTAELHRAAEILVNNAGNIQVGRIIERKMYYNGRMPSHSLQIEAIKELNTFMEATDANNDGEINHDEMDTISTLRPFRLHNENMLSPYIYTADGNGDGNLNKAEAVQFLTSLEFWTLKVMLTYLEVYKRVGREIADEWANSPS